MEWYKIVALVYVVVGLYKLVLVARSLMYAMAYSLYLQPNDRNPLLYIGVYALSSAVVSVVFWPYLLATEGFLFFKKYTMEDVREAIDAAYSEHENT